MASVRWPRLFGRQRLTTITLILMPLDLERQERLYADHLRPIDPARHVESVRAYFLCPPDGFAFPFDEGLAVAPARVRRAGLGDLVRDPAVPGVLEGLDDGARRALVEGRRDGAGAHGDTSFGTRYSVGSRKPMSRLPLTS